MAGDRTDVRAAEVGTDEVATPLAEAQAPETTEVLPEVEAPATPRMTAEERQQRIVEQRAEEEAARKAEREANEAAAKAEQAGFREAPVMSEAEREGLQAAKEFEQGDEDVDMSQRVEQGEGTTPELIQQALQDWYIDPEATKQANAVFA